MLSTTVGDTTMSRLLGMADMSMFGELADKSGKDGDGRTLRRQRDRSASITHGCANSAPRDPDDCPTIGLTSPDESEAEACPYPCAASEIALRSLLSERTILHPWKATYTGAGPFRRDTRIRTHSSANLRQRAHGNFAASG